MSLGKTTSCLFSDEFSLSPVHNAETSLTPTKLLSLAIKKRKELYQQKHSDYRRDVLHTGMIRNLCRYLGEVRANRKRHHSNRSSEKKQSDAENFLQKTSTSTKDIPSTSQIFPLESEYWSSNINNYSYEKPESSNLSQFSTIGNSNKYEPPSKSQKLNDSNKVEKQQCFDSKIMENDLFGLNALQTKSSETDFFPEDYSIAFCDDCNFYDINDTIKDDLLSENNHS